MIADAFSFHAAALIAFLWENWRLPKELRIPGWTIDAPLERFTREPRRLQKIRGSMTAKAIIVSLLIYSQVNLARAASEFYLLGTAEHAQLGVKITRSSDAELEDTEYIKLEFTKGIGSKATVVAERDYPLGFARRNRIKIGPFLGRKRKQVFIYWVFGGTSNDMYDFDGTELEKVYSSDWGTRPEAFLRKIAGKWYIDERTGLNNGVSDFSPESEYMRYSHRAGNEARRLLEWDGSAFQPIRSSFVKGALMPLLNRRVRRASELRAKVSACGFRICPADGDHVFSSYGDSRKSGASFCLPSRKWVSPTSC